VNAGKDVGTMRGEFGRALIVIKYRHRWQKKTAAVYR